MADRLSPEAKARLRAEMQEQAKIQGRDVVGFLVEPATLLALLDECEALAGERDRYKDWWEETANGCIDQAARVWECDPNAPVALNVSEAIDRLESALATAQAERDRLSKTLRENAKHVDDLAAYAFARHGSDAVLYNRLKDIAAELQREGCACSTT